jgi:signal peptidase I
MDEQEKTELNTENAPIAPSMPSPSPSRFSRGLVDQIELIAIAFAIIILLFSFFVRTCEVSGSSMENTLIDGETVLISNFMYEPERGDIVVFHQTSDSNPKFNEPMVKRVIGLPGDTVKIEYTHQTMKVTVISPDGTTTALQEDYIKYHGSGSYTDRTYYVDEGTLFTMGDHRTVSADSRHPDIGLVDSRRILGKVILRITPFEKFGKVE